MDAPLQDVARACLAGAESGTMTFGQIVGALEAAGFEGYQVDLRAGTAAYYLPSGESLSLAAARPAVADAPRFDRDAVVEAIRSAQRGDPGYSYLGFCATVARAGCVGYLVSFPGRRVVYVGRTGETHTEHFPGQA